MTREDAYEFWGVDAVERALREKDFDPITEELAEEIQQQGKSLSPAEFRLWALTQRWGKFCAIIRIVSGVFRESFGVD
jgi:hypothetical protein